MGTSSIQLQDCDQDPVPDLFILTPAPDLYPDSEVHYRDNPDLVSRYQSRFAPGVARLISRVGNLKSTVDIAIKFKDSLKLVIPDYYTIND